MKAGPASEALRVPAWAALRLGSRTPGRTTGERNPKPEGVDMPRTISLGKRTVGDGQPTYVVAEIGINHNGDLEMARSLIDAAAHAGVDALKFQKRTPELCVTAHKRDLK